MTIRNSLLDWAEWHPLGPETEPPINPEVLIFHTMVGGLRGVESYFKEQGYIGDESTWGVGGPWDGATLDGVVWQWQYCNRQADAQFAGNAYACSIETSDGGNPHNPWSSRQLESLIHMTADFCRAYNVPCALVPQTGNPGKGLGYHEWRHDWNLSGHVCPGPVREGQLRTIVIPKARAILAGQPAPPTPKPQPQPAHNGGTIAVDGIFASRTIGAIQHVLLHHGLSCGCPGHPEQPDGVWGPTTRRSLQAYLHSLGLYHGAIDGDIGPASTRALQEHVGASVDGVWGHGTTRHIQEALNNGRF